MQKGKKKKNPSLQPLSLKKPRTEAAASSIPRKNGKASIADGVSPPTPVTLEKNPAPPATRRYGKKATAVLAAAAAHDVAASSVSRKKTVALTKTDKKTESIISPEEAKERLDHFSDLLKARGIKYKMRSRKG